MKHLCCGLLLLAAGCQAAPRPAESAAPSAPALSASVLRDWEDCEQYQGQRVGVEGVFDHVQGKHGKLRLDTGLVLYLPNLDLHLRNKPWFDYVGKRVAVSGILRAYSKPVEGSQGPSIDVEAFQVIQR